MNIEIVDFYVMERDDSKKKLNGSMHVYIVDLDIDLRGLFVTRKNKQIFIYLPTKSGIDTETKEIVYFPIFSFGDMKKTQQLVKDILEVGRPYIWEKVLNVKPKPNDRLKKETF